MRQKKIQGIRAVVMGGGTGTFMVLSSLKHYVNHLSAVINMVDDGGSTGILRDELGALPPGDVRQSLVALSSSSEIMRELFNYRFSNGTFSGHSFGNIFLSTLEKITGNFAKAVATAGEILHITGKVIPVTIDDIRLNAEREDGTIIHGQKMMIRSQFTKEEEIRFYLEPRAKINPEAEKAILEADLIVLGPGNLHSSIIPILLVDGVKVALKKSKAKKIYVANLMTQAEQTENFSVFDFMNEIEKYAGQNCFNYLVYNNEIPAKKVLDRYLRKGEKLVSFDPNDFKNKSYRAIGYPLVSSRIAKQSKNDSIQRPLIRHDGERLSRLIMRLYFSE